MKTYWFLFWAYAVIWGFIAGFLLLLLVRQGKTEQRLQTLERRVAGERRRQDQESSAS